MDLAYYFFGLVMDLALGFVVSSFHWKLHKIALHTVRCKVYMLCTIQCAILLHFVAMRLQYHIIKISYQ